MRKVVLFSVLLGICFSAQVFAGELGCVPKSNQSYPAMGLIASGLSQREYIEVLQSLQTEYEGEIALYGGNLKVIPDWRNDEPNAFADRPWHDTTEWQVVLAGGLARHPAMTKDALTLVGCHEIGHHIGGAPKNRYFRWASTEGQSDYFATLKCMRRMFRNDDNGGIANASSVPTVLRDYCSRQFSDSNESAMCVRSMQAGMDLAKVFAGLAEMAGRTNTAAFEMINTSAVPETFNFHPHTQCRFDTYRAGAFCPIGHTERVSQSDPATGVCSESLGHSKLTLRPTCWYKGN